jgi:phospholipid/cholesterol/gamma-HCH transport system permease protein
MDTPVTASRLFLTRPVENTLQLSIAGEWNLRYGIPPADDIRRELEVPPALQRLIFVTTELGNWDNSLLIFLKNVYELCHQYGIEMDTEALPRGVRGLLKLATAVPVRDTGQDPMEASLLSRIGDVSIRLTKSGTETVGFIGEAFLSFLNFLRGKARFRRSDLKFLIQEAGVQALPIVTLINFLVGVILAFVGSVQLQQFGAGIFVANLVGIAMVREMGPMMTAIIVAGRSGASYAAQLGTMMVNEEIDAYKTLGFSAMDFLVLPRMLALSLMMPLLALYADFLGILGGATVGITMMDISFTQYFEQTRTALAPKHFFLGLIKAYIYGGLVALSGCMRGMQSGRSASAVGAATTSAVVTGIVLIIVACAVTTVIYSILGI